MFQINKRGTNEQNPTTTRQALRAAEWGSGGAMIILHNHEPGLTDDAYIFAYIGRWVGAAKPNNSNWLTVTQLCFANDMFQAQPIALHSRVRMSRWSELPFPSEDDVYAWEEHELSKLEYELITNQRAEAIE